APMTAVVVLAWFVWTQVTISEGVIPGLIPVSSVLAVVGVVWLLREKREGWAFAMTTFAVACMVLSIFIDLYPRVMVSSTKGSYSRPVQNAAASPYSLKVMTVVAIVFLPLVLLYQGWTYYVFRRRVSADDLEPQGGSTASPVPDRAHPAAPGTVPP